MNFKKLVLLWLLAAEVVIFCANFCLSPHGLRAIILAQHNNDALEHDIAVLKDDIARLEQKIILWHKYPYYKEKIARTKLLMARKNEKIYYNQ
jgi:cell division protein FtsB